MARKTKRNPIFLKDEQLQELNRISRTRTAPAQEIQRSKILLSYYEIPNISEVALNVGVVRDTVYKCIDKALEMGVESALKDLYHRPKEPTITMEAKAWLVNIACSKPKDFGMAAELWTQKALADYARKHAAESGHPSLNRAGKATVNRILKNQTLQPHKVKYYLEKCGHVFAQVQHQHRSREFIELLKEIDAYYPLDAQIRIILDNHSSHISKETRAYLATRPGRSLISSIALP